MDESKNLFNVNPIKSVRHNPFTGSSNLVEEPRSHRLNGYDSSILNENSYAKAEDSSDVNYKISTKQGEYNELTGKIKHAELYGTQSEVLSLKARRKRVEQELIDLNKQKSDISFKSSGSEIINIPFIKKAQTFFSRNILAKVSKKFSSIVFLGDSLEKLADINKNVDAIIESKVPYGEKKESYDKLTSYLNEASQIHSQISKTMINFK